MADDELEPLITECPSCHTRFRVAEAQLGRAGGKVRCGACLTVFHGIEHLTLESAQAYADDDQARQALDDVLDELAGDPAAPAGKAGATVKAGRPADESAAPGAPVPFRDRGRKPPLGPIFAGFEEPEAEPQEADITPTFRVVGGGSEAVAADDAAPAEPASARKSRESAVSRTPAADAATSGAAASGRSAAGTQAATDASTAAATADAGAAAVAEDTTEEQPVVFGERPRRRPLVWAGIAVGLLLLVAQVLWYRFDDWAKDPQWQPVYGPLCQVLGCELPQQRDSTLLATRNLAVRTHPSQPDALQVSAMIVNRADFPQPFPVLELRFTTVRGNLVAGRRFEPAEYLAGDAAGMEMMPPRTPVQIELTMDDPGPEAVNYFLRFR